MSFASSDDAVDVALWRREFVTALRDALEDADREFMREFHGARLLQRFVRGWRVRLHLAEQRHFARELQRCYRGHLARRRTRALVDAKYAARRGAVRHYAAGVVQRLFRGFYSRKHLHDYYARKAFVVAVAAKGEALRAELDAAFAAQLAARLDADEVRAREAFARTAQGLHHLVSTRAQRGVWNPPYAERAEDVPSAFGVPLETHLRVGSLRHIRTHGLHPASAQRGAVTLSDTIGEKGARMTASVTALGERHATIVPSYVQADSRRTLTATAPFGAVEQARREEARHRKMANLDQRAFVAGAKSRLFEGPLPLGTASETPFVEPWLNARTTRELEHIADRDKRVSDKPYVPASSRSSRLFEDSERRKAAFTAALLEATDAAPTSAAASAGRSLNTTTTSVTIGNSTLRRSDGAPPLRSQQAPPPSTAQLQQLQAAADAAGAAAYSAFPAGSAAAAVRRARSANSASRGSGDGGGGDADDFFLGDGVGASVAPRAPEPVPPPLPPTGRPPLPAATASQQLVRKRPVMKPVRRADPAATAGNTLR